MAITLPALLRRRLNALVLPQAVRLAELVAARGRKGEAGVGGDLRLAEEPAHLRASERMRFVSGDIAAIEDRDGRLDVTTNVMGLAGATPALPAFYSELQLQRRRARDRSLERFLNIFDHRALSFFYRIFRKYHPLVAFEREARPGNDPLSRSLLALSGFGLPAQTARLSFDAMAIAPLAHHLAGTRRTAAGLAIVLRHITGLAVRVIEATPVWMAMPADAQTRLGMQASRLGGVDAAGLGHVDAAVIGTAMIDIQHHYRIAVGPLGHAELLRFCTPDGPARAIGEICLLYTGIAYRAAIVLSIAARDIPPLQLASSAAPAYLGRTTWLGSLGPTVREDCAITIDLPVAA